MKSAIGNLMGVSAITVVILLLTAILPSSARSQSGSDLSSFISVEGTYTRSLGNLSPIFPSAAGGYVSYGHYFPEQIVAMLKVGYSGYEVSDNATPSGQKLSAVHLLAGPRYYFTTNGLMPFLFLNVGLNFVTTKIDVGYFQSDRTSTQFGWQVGFGATLPITGPIGLEVQAKYNAHFLYHEGSTEGLEGLGNMTGFEYGLGVTWGLR
ncbi:MAG: hypothetical protein OEV30_05470 [Ignavibacteria bacterium]|nr:hypothetical protein [Ignavibacteria bacterium]